MNDLRREVAEYLRYLGEIGLDGLALRHPSPVRRTVQSQAAPAPATRSLFDEEMPEIPEGLPVDEALEWVRTRWLGDCTRCKLHEGRTSIVFGTGNPESRLMFVGEGPGRDEDIQGEPFVGRAGQLLTKIIEAMEMRRADVYIANILKCRPPNNRDPEPDEVAACRCFLEAQISLIGPEVLVLLGRVAVQTLLNVKTPMGRLRGQFHQVMGVPAMVTWHPAYLLRNPRVKRDTWEDMKRVLDRLAGKP